MFTELRMLLLLAALVLTAQLSRGDEAQQSTRADDSRLERIVFGCIEVPNGASFEVTESLVDASLGYIQLTTDSPRVWFFAGLMESPLDPKDGLEVIWTGRVETRGAQLAIVVGEGHRTLAYQRSPRLTFAVPGGTIEDVDFLKSVASLHRPDCEGRP